MKAKLVFVQHRRTFVLDDVNERHGLCGGLGCSVKDHVENICCIGEITKLFMEAGSPC